MRVYSKFGHHPYPLGYLWAKFGFLASIAELVHEKKIAYSINHSPSLFDAPVTEAFAPADIYTCILVKFVNQGHSVCVSSLQVIFLQVKGNVALF